MDQYRLFDKIVKSKPCTFYKAQYTPNRQPIIVKKIHKQVSWQHILKSKQLSLFKNAKTKYFPQVKQLIKDQDRFYIILQNLQQNLEIVIKSDISKEEIIKITKNLLNMLNQFKKQKIIPLQLRPAYFFLSNQRDVLKLGHLQISQRDFSKLDLVQLQDLKYLSPEQVLTSKQVDDRALIFNAGLIIFQLITGKNLINANTKMNYMYQICKLFPQQKFNIQQSNIKQGNAQSPSRIISNNNQASRVTNQSNNINPIHTDSFDKIMKQQNITPQFTALLKEMLKIDRSQRITLETINQTFDLIAQNQLNFEKNLTNPGINFSNKNVFDMSPQDMEGIKFDFETKPTLSSIPCISSQSHVLATEKNVEDDSVQPIIIKQSSKPLQNQKTGVSIGAGMSIQPTKQSSKQSRINNKNSPSFTTIKRPQLTNYAMNEANLGVQVGLNPSLFSDNDI